MLYPQVVEVARSGEARRARRGAGARRVALVTGGSGALSRAVARRLARDGLAVAVNDVGDSAADVVGAIREDGGIADAFSADVTAERQVAELAAAGKGNRAIAQELFLSVKTVETHLAAGYRKLGVSTRSELAAELAA